MWHLEHLVKKTEMHTKIWLETNRNKVLGIRSHRLEDRNEVNVKEMQWKGFGMD